MKEKRMGEGYCPSCRKSKDNCTCMKESLKSVVSTIMDRAKAYSKTQAIECYAYCGYVRGATDQQAIDIEKVYHALEKVLSQQMLDELVKAMKGE